VLSAQGDIDGAKPIKKAVEIYAKQSPENQQSAIPSDPGDQIAQKLDQLVALSVLHKMR
jgi:hypothetical protein